MPILAGVDTNLFYTINHGCSNPILNFLMPMITILGSAKFVLTFTILLMLIVVKPKKIAGLLLFAGLVMSLFAVHFLKVLFAEPRPFMVLKNVHLLAAGLDKSPSFPSGHATLAFMVAVILANYFKRKYLFFLIAIAICFSRVYLGVHYVSDVAAGALIGSAIGCVLVHLAKRLRRE